MSERQIHTLCNCLAVKKIRQIVQHITQASAESNVEREQHNTRMFWGHDENYTNNETATIAY